MGRLDKVLANPSWLQKYPNSKVQHLEFIGSDHTPIVLETNNQTYNRSQPFKFYKMWLREDSCKQIFNDIWAENHLGSPAYSG